MTYWIKRLLNSDVNVEIWKYTNSESVYLIVTEALLCMSN